MTPPETQKHPKVEEESVVNDPLSSPPPPAVDPVTDVTAAIEDAGLFDSTEEKVTRGFSSVNLDESVEAIQQVSTAGIIEAEPVANEAVDDSSNLNEPPPSEPIVVDSLLNSSSSIIPDVDAHSMVLPSNLDPVPDHNDTSCKMVDNILDSDSVVDVASDALLVSNSYNDGIFDKGDGTRLTDAKDNSDNQDACTNDQKEIEVPNFLTEENTTEINLNSSESKV